MNEATELSPLDAFGADLDALFAKHKTGFLSNPAVGNWDSVLEALMLGIVAIIEADKQQQAHSLVVSCLSSAQQHLREAAFAYYASFK